MSQPLIVCTFDSKPSDLSGNFFPNLSVLFPFTHISRRAVSGPSVPSPSLNIQEKEVSTSTYRSVVVVPSAQIHTFLQGPPSSSPSPSFSLVLFRFEMNLSREAQHRERRKRRAPRLLLPPRFIPLQVATSSSQLKTPQISGPSNFSSFLSSFCSGLPHSMTTETNIPLPLLPAAN